RNSRDHVRQEGAGESVECAILALVVGPRHDDLVAVARDRDARGRRVLELAFRPLDLHTRALDHDVDPRRNRDRLLADSGPAVCSYQTWQRTSPPTLRWRASRSVIRPWFVERMAIPMPPSTRGTSVAFV